MLKISHISKTFNPGTVNEKTALHDFSLNLEPADFVSPHSDINAACAAVPDRTWFYYNMEHEQAAENTALLELVAAIASSDEPIDVFTLPDHPQFVDYC